MTYKCEKCPQVVTSKIKYKEKCSNCGSNLVEVVKNKAKE